MHEVDMRTDDRAVDTIQKSPKKPSKVLLVEDNAGDALLVGQALADCPTPVHLHIARDGEQALQMLGEPDYHPDVIILDLNIPKISGHAVLARYPRKKTPVVIFSASESEVDLNRAFSLGANEFIHKPLDLDDYKGAVTGIVRKWAAPRSTRNSRN
jgi:CheY-like chemotaxis protein